MIIWLGIGTGTVSFFLLLFLPHHGLVIFLSLSLFFRMSLRSLRSQDPSIQMTNSVGCVWPEWDAPLGPCILPLRMHFSGWVKWAELISRSLPRDRPRNRERNQGNNGRKRSKFTERRQRSCNSLFNQDSNRGKPDWSTDWYSSNEPESSQLSLTDAGLFHEHCIVVAFFFSVICYALSRSSRQIFPFDVPQSLVCSHEKHAV